MSYVCIILFFIICIYICMSYVCMILFFMICIYICMYVRMHNLILHYMHIHMYVLRMHTVIAHRYRIICSCLCMYTLIISPGCTYTQSSICNSLPPKRTQRQRPQTASMEPGVRSMVKPGPFPGRCRHHLRAGLKALARACTRP